MDASDGASLDGNADGEAETGEAGPEGEFGDASVDDVTYSYFVPACVEDTEGPFPALFTFHGSGGRGDGLVAAWAPVAAEHCFIVIGQDSADLRGWGFGDDGGNFLSLLTESATRFDVDQSRRFVHGYSAGAHWIYGFGLFNSNHFAGLAVFAGSLEAAIHDGIWPDQVGDPIPVFIAHGTEDSVVPYEQATFAEDQLESARWPVTLWTAEGGSHAYDAAHQEAAWLYWQEALGGGG